MATLEMNVRQVNSDFQAIKDKIVEHGVEVADGTKTAEYASKVDDVFEAGKKAEYDAFWDTFQQNGERTEYVQSFGMGWVAELFRPKYDIIAAGAYLMFSQFSYGIPVNLKQLLADAGISLTFPKCYNFSLLFQSAGVTDLGELDFSTATRKNCSKVFIHCNFLKNIDKIILPEGQTTFDTWFYNCYALENMTIEGTIGANGLNLQWSTKLSKASITSIVNALSTTTSGLTVTLSKTAVNNAFETSEGAADGSTSTEWTTLIGTKNNWTISLV